MFPLHQTPSDVRSLHFTLRHTALPNHRLCGFIPLPTSFSLPPMNPMAFMPMEPTAICGTRTVQMIFLFYLLQQRSEIGHNSLLHGNSISDFLLQVR